MTRRLIGLVLAAAVAGCGSTVQMSGADRTGETIAGTGLGQVPVAVDESGAAQSPAATGPATDVGTGQGSGPRGGEPDVPGVSSVPVPGTAVSGPGVTRTTVAVGIIYSGNAGTANNAYGTAGTENGTLDARVWWDAIVADTNAHGGIAGRRIVPQYFNLDSNSNNDGQMQQICQQFTVDSKVFAVLGGVAVNDILRRCLQDKGVVLLEDGASITDQQTFSTYPTYFEVSMLNLTHASELKVENLVKRGFITQASKIGVLTFDDLGYQRAYQRGLKPALARHGFSVTADAAIPLAITTDQVGNESAAVSSAVLKFNQAHVDRVLFIESTGDIALLFMAAAESQLYRPRYGLDSHDGGAALPQNVPPAQLAGAIGIGWIPVTDVLADQDPGNPAKLRCLNAFRAQRQTFTRTTEPAAVFFCDETWFLATVASRALATGGLSAQSFRVSADGLGTSYSSPSGFGTRYDGDKHDGAATFREFAFFADCTCYRYTSSVQAIA